MRSTVKALFTGLTVTMFAAGTTIGPQATTSDAAVAGPKVMVVGDSISQGLEGDFTWRYRLSESLSRTGTPVDFVGPWVGTQAISAAPHSGGYRPGISFDQNNLAQWGWQMHQAKDVIASNVATFGADYLLVELGFNDLGWGVNPPAGVLNDFEWLVYNARMQNPNITILVSNVPHRSALSNLPNLPADISDYNSRLAARVPQLSSAASRISVVDIDGPYDELRDTYDGLHPNVRGEYVIAKAFADSLASAGFGGPFGAIPTALPANLAPSPPTSITATPVGEDIQVSWAHAFGASGYQFYSRDATTNGAFTPGIYDISADTWVAGLLPAGHRMEFYVRTSRGTYKSGASPTATATVAPLGEVLGLVATTDPLKPYTVTLNWNPVAGAKDYSVYAAAGCDSVPPNPSAYTIQQWGLGAKTTWTQEFVLLPCINYKVVATRYGGEGVRSANSSRAWPYQNNYYHLLARNRYIDIAADPGGQRATTMVAPTTDRGVVVVRGFIANTGGLNNLIGDQRTFDINPYASSKIGIGWDTSSGEVGVYVHQSCLAGNAPVTFFQLGCHNALPIRFVSNAALYGDSSTSLFNYVSTSLSSSGVLTITVSAVNSWTIDPTPSLLNLGRINATVTLTPSGSSYKEVLTGDRFPSWEIYRYPRTGVLAGTVLGKTHTIGTRGQTAIADLKSGVMSTCTSAVENTTGLTNPMAC